MLLHRKKLQSLLHKIFIYTVLHIPSHTMENWDLSSYTPLLISLAHLIQGHNGALTLKRGFDVLGFR